MLKDENREPLLGDTFKKPVWIVWLFLLPQILLLILNLGAWDLVSGEMTPEQKGMALGIFFFETAMLAVMAYMFFYLLMSRKIVSWTYCVITLALHVAYLWMITAWLDKLLPASVTLWILPQTKLLYHQYALMMPGLFYSATRLATFHLKIGKWQDFGFSAAVLIIIPIFWFLVLQTLVFLFRWAEPPFVVMMIFLVGSTVLIMLAFLRVLVFVYNKFQEAERYRYILLALVGLAAPIGGLCLNITIPFPYDFQDPWVYILTVINGMVLLVPFKKDSLIGQIPWLLRAVMYPFSLYFFIVFLPFLPLSLLAMIACGAGCLILAPTLLFIVHTRYLVDQGRELSGLYGRTKVVLLFIAALCVIPVFYTGRAVMDKHALMSAVDAVYSPDYTSGRVDIDPARVKRSLERLRARKDGLYVPFLSDYYGKLVFGGMVLPDHKMDEIYKVFFDKKMEVGEEKGRMLDGFFRSGGRRRGGRGSWQARTTPPERNVALVSIDKIQEPCSGAAETMVELTMRNHGGNASEFVTRIVVPEGVFVSGFWLKVGDEKVPGRIFEKKAAEWVYHMIRDTERRDPGLLVYERANELKLNVFPFAGAEERKAGIKFLYPAGMAPVVRIGEQDVSLAEPGGEVPGRIFSVDRPGGRYLIVPPESAGKMATATRQPYLHLIIDASRNAAAETVELQERTQAVISKMPYIRKCRFTTANYEFVHNAGLVDADKVVDQIDFNALPFRGALCAEKAIKSALLEYMRSMPIDESGLPMVPVFVVIKSSGCEVMAGSGLDAFARSVPDTADYYVTTKGGKFNRMSFAGGYQDDVDDIGRPSEVILIRSGTGIAVCPAKHGGIAVMDKTGGDLRVYNPGSGEFDLLEGVRPISNASLLTKAYDLADLCGQAETQPRNINGILPEVVKLSREHGLLSPLTSYIVVENSAQWKMLEKSEKESLNADHALEFDEHIESPEPSLWLLIPLSLLFFVRKRRTAYCSEREVIP